MLDLDKLHPAVFVVVLVLFATLFFLFGSTVDPTNKKKSKKPPIALEKDEFRAFPLIDIVEISHDVKKFRFGLPTKNHRLGLPIGQHISLKYTDENGEDVIRSYTPTSSDDDLGFVDFVIKIYFKNVHPKFPNGKFIICLTCKYLFLIVSLICLGGKMSQHINSLKIGDSILMKGPKGQLEYLGKGKFTIKRLGETTTSTYQKKKIGMIAGGTGITPMLQIIHAILKDPEDTTQLWLIFANQTEEDILLRRELEAIPSTRLKLFYTLDRPPTEGWKYGSGFVNIDMCRDHLPAPGSDTMIYLCGPPPMIKHACEPALENLGFDRKDWFAF
jgi:cytochrome-b5 reductase